MYKAIDFKEGEGTLTYVGLPKHYVFAVVSFKMVCNFQQNEIDFAEPVAPFGILLILILMYMYLLAVIVADYRVLFK